MKLLFCLSSFFLIQLSFGQTVQKKEVPPVVIDFAHDLEERVIRTLSFSQVLEEYRKDLVAVIRTVISNGSAFYAPMAQLTDDELGNFILGRSDFQLVCLSFGMANLNNFFYRSLDLNLLPKPCRRSWKLMDHEYSPPDKGSLDAALKEIQNFDPSIARQLLSSRYQDTSLYNANKKIVVDVVRTWIEPREKINGVFNNAPFFLIHILYFDVGIALIAGEPRVFFISLHDS